MSIGAGFGLAAILAAIIGAFVPVIGLFIGWTALLLATVGALCGDKGFAIATTLISAVVFFFLTPSLWLDYAVGDQNVTGNGGLVLWVSMMLLAAPVAAILLYSSGTFMLNDLRPVISSRFG